MVCLLEQGLIQQLRPLLNLYKFRLTQAFWSESGHQEDYAIRSFHVLFAHVKRNEIITLLQPREHNLYT